MGSLTGERLIRGAGTAESTWQSWPGMETMGVEALDRWLAATQRLVVVAPHPDDEVLACGGMLSMHAAQGGPALVVAVTDGEASHAASGPLIERLASARRAESTEGMRRLGLRDTEVVRLGLPDGAVHRHLAELNARLRVLLRSTDRVVSTWRYDGHPDHEVTAVATAEACELCRCLHAEAPVWMWHWAVPADARVPWDRLKRFRISPRAHACKIHALDAHVTQLSPRGDGQGPVLGKGVLDRVARRHEYLFV